MGSVPSRWLFSGLVLISLSGSAFAQAKRPTASPGATKPLDLQAEKIQADYLQGLSKLASDYEDAGDIDKSAAMLKEILKIKPDVESVKNKLKQFEESVFENNSVTMEVDSAKNWVTTGVAVTKDKPIRIESSGTYKFIVNDTLGPNGYENSEPLQEITGNLPAGSLIAMVAPTDRNRKDQPQPVFVGAGKEITFKESGLLLLKLNVPSNAKCTGKIKVKISGNLTPAR